MNAYDFDKTIYRGDSTIDFYCYCLRHHPMLIRYLPKQMAGMIAYKRGRIDKTQCKEIFYIFLNGLVDVEQEVFSFWNQNEKKIKRWYLNQKQSDDVIVSASPEFLLGHICKKMNVGLICSRVDGRTGAYNGKNCYGEEKVRRFQEQYGEQAQIEKFYSDSKSDAPMTEIAGESFLVRGDLVKEWKR